MREGSRGDTALCRSALCFNKEGVGALTRGKSAELGCAELPFKVDGEDLRELLHKLLLSLHS